jgi:hypothetical protein
MSKIVKLKQQDIEKIVNNIVTEGQDLNEDMSNKPGLKIFLGKDENGVVYVVNAETGDILGSKDMSGKIAGLTDDSSDYAMAAE